MDSIWSNNFYKSSPALCWVFKVSFNSSYSSSEYQPLRQSSEQKYSSPSRITYPECISIPQHSHILFSLCFKSTKCFVFWSTSVTYGGFADSIHFPVFGSRIVHDRSFSFGRGNVKSIKHSFNSLFFSFLLHKALCLHYRQFHPRI